MKYLKPLSLAILFVLLSNLIFSQDEKMDNTKDEALKVFIDCDFCDIDYIRNNINYVNYVRDTRVAQVHVLTTTQRTGSGGTQYTFNFIGQFDFKGLNDTISTIVKADATSDERREMRTKFLKMGLMQYVVKTPMVEFMTIDYTHQEDSTAQEEVVDKWNYWVFRLSGNGWFNGEEVYKSRNLNASFSANRITEKLKIENWGDIGVRESSFKIDSVTHIVNSNRNFYFKSSAILSLNNHWSAGLIMTLNSSTYRNIKLNHRVLPAIEYNIFKYDDFTTKQIRLQYKVGYNDFRYVDTTIYNQVDEKLFHHSISIAAQFKQKWGSVSFSTTASQYLHDPDLKKLTIFGSVSWRIVKGLSFNTSGNLDFIQDQISLPKGGATNVEILTQQRQLATQYSYWGSVGISYTFGSIYNNVVNPRFGN